MNDPLQHVLIAAGRHRSKEVATFDRTAVFDAGRAGAVIPTNDGLVCLPVAVPYGELRAFRGDVEGNYLRTIERSPSLAERVRAGRREEPFRAMADVPNFFRKPYGSGWALVGDVGYHNDPVTAQGISDAFRDAQRLAEAIGAGLSGQRDLAAALADYERRRNEAAMPQATVRRVLRGL